MGGATSESFGCVCDGPDGSGGSGGGEIGFVNGERVVGGGVLTVGD